MNDAAKEYGLNSRPFTEHAIIFHRRNMRANGCENSDGPENEQGDFSESGESNLPDNELDN